MESVQLARRGLLAAALLSAVVALGVSSQRATASGGNPAILEPAQGALFGAWTKARAGRTVQQELAYSEQEIGRPFDIYHLYYHVSQTLPTADMISAANSGHTVLMAFDPDPVNSQPTWQEIYQGQQDATLIKRAQELRDFGKPVMLNFDHEADANIGPNGTAADYVKAYQHVHDLFVAQGATNVIWVWDMRGSLFTSTAAANAMYPGDKYVDWVAADAYNWYPGKSGSNWRSFADAFSPFHQWANQVHPGIPQMAEETGVQEDTATPDPTRKAAWIRDMAATIKSWPEMKAVVWFNSNQIYPWWYDSSSASLSAFRAVGQDCYFQTRASSCDSSSSGGSSGTGSSGGGTGSTTDTSAPSAPSALAASNVQSDSFTLSWNAATDDFGVTGYNVYVNGTKVTSTTALSKGITGTPCPTGCSAWVEAFDAAGNTSPRAGITVQTPVPQTTLALSGLTATVRATQVKISFNLAAPSTVSLLILNESGTTVTHKLVNVTLSAGVHTYYWKLKDDHGQQVPSGTYGAVVSESGSAGPGSASVYFHV